MLSGEELKQLIWFRSLSMAEQRRLAPSSMTQTTTSASSAEGFCAATRAGRKKLTAVLEPETHKQFRMLALELGKNGETLLSEAINQRLVLEIRQAAHRLKRK